MKKISLIVTTFLFLFWLIPLGVFIKPSLEKVACDGQRAFCMCSHTAALKVQHAPMEQSFAFKGGAPSEQKELSGSSGAGHYFVGAKRSSEAPLLPAILVSQQHPSYSNPFLLSLEHVPKI